MDNDFSQRKQESTSSSSPILQRTSDFYDEDYRYDSVSVVSGSTVANSEFIEKRVKEYEKYQNNAEAINNPTVYNLRIDNFVIDAKAKNQEIDKQFVSQIISNLSQTSPKNFKARKNTKWQGIKEKASKPKYLFPSLLFLIVLIGLSIGIPLSLRNNNEKENPADQITTAKTTQSTQKPTTSWPATSSSPTTPPPTTPAPTTIAFTTTTLNPNELHIVNKSEWIENGLSLEGKFKQNLPIKKIIVMTTKAEACDDKETCIDSIVNLQLESYPEFDDILFNFLIAPNGMVFEGRSYEREGEAVIFEDTKTSFDAQAISIVFMLSEEKMELEPLQLKHFCNFLNHSIINNKISENYIVFAQSLLLQTNDNLMDFSGECTVELEKIPTFVRRQEWNSQDFPLENDFYYRKRSSKVIIGSTDGPTCESKESCGQIVKSLQQNSASGEIEWNFIFAGRNFIFEGRNFDAAVSIDFYDSLYFLVIGRIESEEEAQEIFNQIDEFLSFAVDMSKLFQNYKIYGQTQIKDALFSFLRSLIEGHPHFGDSLNSTKAMNDQC